MLFLSNSESFHDRELSELESFGGLASLDRRVERHVKGQQPSLPAFFVLRKDIQTNLIPTVW